MSWWEEEGAGKEGVGGRGEEGRERDRSRVSFSFLFSSAHFQGEAARRLPTVLFDEGTESKNSPISVGYHAPSSADVAIPS